MVAEIVSCFERTVAFMLGLVADVPDEEMTVQPPGVPNHAAWTLGHIIYSCQAIAGELGVEPWLLDGWERWFAYGSTPDGSSSRYPRKAVLLAVLADASDRLRRALVTADPAKLAAPLPDEKARDILPSLGHAVVQVVAGHTAFHAGQLAVWRRATGRAAVGVFI
jgi:hypothetical protein